MAAVARTYLPGYTASNTIDSIAYDSDGWSASPDGGLYDVTNEKTGGWSMKEPGIQTVVFSQTLMAKVSQPIPPIKIGDILPGIYKIYNVVAYTGNVIVTGLDVKNDLKGNVTFDLKAENYGPMQGTMAPTVVTVPTS